MEGASSSKAILKQSSVTVRVKWVKRTRIFTKKPMEVSLDASTSRLISRLEAEFDLMRLRQLRAELSQKEARLAKKVEILRDSMRSPSRALGSQAGYLAQVAWLRRWRHVVVTWGKILWLETRRGTLVEDQRRLLMMEDDIQFGMRIVGVRMSSDVSEWYQCDPRVDLRLRASFAWPLGLLSVDGTLSSMLGQPLGLT
jgi:hypothetical protein